MMSSEGKKHPGQKEAKRSEAKRSEGSSGRAFRGPKRRSKDSRSKTRHLAEELFTATSERDTPFQPREGCGAAFVRSHVLRAPPSQCGFRSPGEPSLQRTAQFLRLPSVTVTGVARLVKQLGFCFFEAERPLFILASSVATASPSCARVCSRLPPPFRLGLQPQGKSLSLYRFESLSLKGLAALLKAAAQAVRPILANARCRTVLHDVSWRQSELQGVVLDNLHLGCRGHEPLHCLTSPPLEAPLGTWALLPRRLSFIHDVEPETHARFRRRSRAFVSLSWGRDMLPGSPC